MLTDFKTAMHYKYSNLYIKSHAERIKMRKEAMIACQSCTCCCYREISIEDRVVGEFDIEEDITRCVIMVYS